jgi:hypothetical protein
MIFNFFFKLMALGVMATKYLNYLAIINKKLFKSTMTLACMNLS